MEYQRTDQTLTIIVDDEERAVLQDLCHQFDFGSNDTMYCFLEDLIVNSELAWIDPANTGDLTDAPMLGILGEEGQRDNTVFLENYGLVETGNDGHWTLCRPILKRWAFMSYQVQSVLETLMNEGRAVFISGE